MAKLLLEPRLKPLEEEKLNQCGSYTHLLLQQSCSDEA